MARSKTVRADRTQAHIKDLIAQGANSTSISDACGVAPTVVRAIERGDRDLILRETQDKILAIKKPPIGALRSAAGARRKLMALAVQGYSLRTIAADIPMATQGYMSDVRRGHKRYILKARDEEIDAYYAKHKDRKGSDAQTATRAAKLGWLGPEAWEGVDINNPKSTPNVQTE